jgi:hypothetical protein
MRSESGGDEAMSSEEEKIRAIFDKAAVDVLVEFDADDELRDLAKRAAPLSFFPNGAISLVQEAIRRTGLSRRNVRVEWIEEHATVKTFVSNVNADDIDAIMEQAIFMMPLGIGIDVQPEAP